jgi:hypothetical protein
VGAAKVIVVPAIVYWPDGIYLVIGVCAVPFTVRYKVPVGEAVAIAYSGGGATVSVYTVPGIAPDGVSMCLVAVKDCSKVGETGSNRTMPGYAERVVQVLFVRFGSVPHAAIAQKAVADAVGFAPTFT